MVKKTTKNKNKLSELLWFTDLVRTDCIGVDFRSKVNVSDWVHTYVVEKTVLVEMF